MDVEMITLWRKKQHSNANKLTGTVEKAPLTWTMY